MAHYDYLILGNSAAAVTAVESIRIVDASSSIRMVSPEPYAAYGTPLISYLLEGKTSQEAMAYKTPTFYEDNAVETTFGGGFGASALDAAAHTVTLDNGEVISYGKVLVATGSVPFTPPIKGLIGASNMSTFLTLDQALFCADQVGRATQAAHDEARSSRLIVVGAGLIGLKAAEALHDYADEVIVLEMAPRILPAVLDAEGAALMTDLLVERGITCLPGITADEFIVNDNNEIVEAHLTNGATLECDFVVAAVGVRPNVALLEMAGAEIGRGVIVGDDLQTSLLDVYAAGDVTQTHDLLDGSNKCLALWPNAVRQGRLAGLHMAGFAQADDFKGNFAVNSVDFFDEIYLLTAGVINPDPDQDFEEIITLEGDTYTKFVTKNNRLYGYITLNRPEAAGIYTSIIADEVPLDMVGGEAFLREPENFDIEEPLRWARLHKGYPASLDAWGWSVKNPQDDLAADTLAAKVDFDQANANPLSEGLVERECL